MGVRPPSCIHYFLTQIEKEKTRQAQLMTERCSCQETVTSLQEELGLPTSEPAQASKGRLAGAQHLRIIGERP